MTLEEKLTDIRDGHRPKYGFWWIESWRDHMHIKLWSTIKGVCYMRRVFRGIHYSVERISREQKIRWWFHMWTPKWHEGRGPYITIGLGRVAFYRGY